MGATLTARRKAQHSDMIVLWSISMLATDIHFTPRHRDGSQRGAKVYCTSLPTARRPPTTPTPSSARAPGTDGALALTPSSTCLCATASPTAPFLKEYVRSGRTRSKVLPHYTPSCRSHHWRPPPANIQAFFHACGNARAPFIRLGSGQSRYKRHNMTSPHPHLPARLRRRLRRGSGGPLTSSTAALRQEHHPPRPDLSTGVPRQHVQAPAARSMIPDLTPPIKALYIYSSKSRCRPRPEPGPALTSSANLFTVNHERSNRHHPTTR